MWHSLWAWVEVLIASVGTGVLAASVLTIATVLFRGGLDGYELKSPSHQVTESPKHKPIQEHHNASHRRR